MKRNHPLYALALVLVVLCPSWGLAQALPNASTLRVVYNSRKATVNPQGELKAQIDAVDKEVADAIRAGRMGEVRRQLAKGMALLNGIAWTPALDFQNSLALRTDRVVADSSAPYSVRVEQIYAPAIDLTPNLTARARLRTRAARPGAPADAAPRDLGTFDSVSRDLRESPFAMELDVSGADDGAYGLEVEIVDGTTSIGTTTLGVVLQKGLDARVRALLSAAAALPEAVRADVTYPGDYIRNVNRGRIGIGTFNLAAELAAAEGLLATAKTGKDPFKGRTGDMERHYVLQGANEVMPYRVYVPKGYLDAKPMPLVIALHGLGANEDSMFDSYQKLPPQLAEQHGFLLAAPMGYRVDGFYGSGLMGGTDAASRRRSEYSEKDVLEVLRLMRANYKVDESRVYLIGHSMGAIGTWFLGAKYPETWAALVSFSGVGAPATAERMKNIPQFVVHGDADPTVNVSGSRTMVAAMQKLGMEVTYIEVAGGNHTDVVVPNFPKAFDFLAAHAKAGTAATKQQ